MHVALVSADCVPNPGGVASHVFNLAVALKALDNDVTVLGGCQDGEGLAAFTPPFDGFVVRRIGRMRKLSVASFALWARRRIRHRRGVPPVDVVHIHTFLAEALVFLGLHRRICRVATNHSSSFLETQEKGERRWAYRFLLGSCDAVIAPSRELEEKSTYLGVPTDRIHYIRNGVDVDGFTPGPADPQDWEMVAPFTPRHRIVVATRRLVRKNGIDLLLDAIRPTMERSPEARFIVAGDGPERAALEAQARALGVESHVKFLGDVPNSRIRRLYRLADVCVLPSRREATSISGLEAMACGLALVGTRVGGIPEIIQDGVSGILVDSEEPPALADGLARLLGNRGLAKEMGERSRQRARAEFSWPSVARETMEVYEACRRSRSP